MELGRFGGAGSLSTRLDPARQCTFPVWHFSLYPIAKYLTPYSNGHAGLFLAGSGVGFPSFCRLSLAGDIP